jgi:flagellar hook-basal body complex protein FliE
MRVTFRGTALHDIGHLYLADGYEHLATELPARQRHTLTVRLDTPDNVEGWSAHRAALSLVIAALSVPEGTLLVALDDGTVLHNRPVVVLSAPKLPQDTDPQGTYTQALEVVFAWDEVLTPPRLVTTFTPVGGTAVDLGEVTGFDTGSTAVRSSDYSDFEERVSGKVSASGVVHATDPSASLAARRTDLVAKLAAMEAAMVDEASARAREAGAADVSVQVRRDLREAEVEGQMMFIEAMVTAVASAQASLETVMAVRDQVISAYQEIMRMPI